MWIFNKGLSDLWDIKVDWVFGNHRSLTLRLTPNIISTGLVVYYKNKISLDSIVGYFKQTLKPLSDPKVPFEDRVVNYHYHYTNGDSDIIFCPGAENREVIQEILTWLKKDPVVRPEPAKPLGVGKYNDIRKSLYRRALWKNCDLSFNFSILVREKEYMCQLLIETFTSQGSTSVEADVLGEYCEIKVGVFQTKRIVQGLDVFTKDFRFQSDVNAAQLLRWLRSHLILLLGYIQSGGKTEQLMSTFNDQPVLFKLKTDIGSNRHGSYTFVLDSPYSPKMINLTLEFLEKARELVKKTGESDLDQDIMLPSAPDNLTCRACGGQLEKLFISEESCPFKTESFSDYLRAQPRPNPVFTTNQ